MEAADINLFAETEEWTPHLQIGNFRIFISNIFCIQLIIKRLIYGEQRNKIWKLATCNKIKYHRQSMDYSQKKNQKQSYHRTTVTTKILIRELIHFIWSNDNYQCMYHPYTDPPPKMWGRLKLIYLLSWKASTRWKDWKLKGLHLRHTSYSLIIKRLIYSAQTNKMGRLAASKQMKYYPGSWQIYLQNNTSNKIIIIY